MGSKNSNKASASRSANNPPKKRTREQQQKATTSKSMPKAKKYKPSSAFPEDRATWDPQIEEIMETNYRGLQCLAKTVGVRANTRKDVLRASLLRDINLRSMRVGFIRKVYCILSVQLLLTVAIAYLCTIQTMGIRQLVIENLWLHRPLGWTSMVLLFALKYNAKSYPMNMALLMAWTVVMSLVIGPLCALYVAVGQGAVLCQAAGMTMGIFMGLTIFTFKSKYDFSWMGGILFTILWGMLLFSLASALLGFSMGILYSYLGATLFSFYIVFDTHRLMNELDYDEYIEACIQLYLDILNLFLKILKILSKLKKKKK